MTVPWLVVNADDLGVSEGANAGILRAHREGIVTSASLAVTTQSYKHALTTCVQPSPGLGVGLHLTLTSGTPVSPPARVSRLTRADGRFRHRFSTLLRETGGGGNTALLDEIEIEIDAQIGRMIGDGVRPDHINGERHVHLIPGIFDRVVSAARRHGIAFVRAGRDLGPRMVKVSHLLPIIFGGGFIKSGLLSSLSASARAKLGGGVTSPDSVASYVHTGRLDVVLPALLNRAEPGITEVMVHPGIPEENHRLDLGNSELERYLLSPGRRAEMNACIAARGHTGAWQLTNYRTLAAARA